MQSILNLIMGAGFKIIGEAMIMQRELAASLSTAGEKVMDFPYCFDTVDQAGLKRGHFADEGDSQLHRNCQVQDYASYIDDAPLTCGLRHVRRQMVGLALILNVGRNFIVVIPKGMMKSSIRLKPCSWDLNEAGPERDEVSSRRPGDMRLCFSVKVTWVDQQILDQQI